MVLLIGTVYIIEDGLHISIDGGQWKVYPAFASKMEDNSYSIGNVMTSADQPQITSQFTAPNIKVSNLYY